MRLIFVRFFLVLSAIAFYTMAIGQQIPSAFASFHDKKPDSDWLVTSTDNKATIYFTVNKQGLILSNGLVKRIFTFKPGFACVDYTNMSNSEQLLRSVMPEARLTINDSVYDVGGITGPKEKAYFLTSWLDSMKPLSSGFSYTGFTIDSITPAVRWKNSTWSSVKNMPTGKMLSFSFKGTSEHVKNIRVLVHYELYDNLPLMVKWLEIKNTGDKSVRINRVVNELLAVVEEESAVVGTEVQMKKPHGIYVETNYAFNNAMRYDLSDQTTHWKKDTSYTSQVNYNYTTPCLLEVYPDQGPGVDLEPGKTFRSVRTHELLIDSYDRERRALMIRKMYKTVAPWTSQNPIFMHLVSKNDEEVKNAIEQCAATGYEALILSFGSHCQMEDTTAENIRRWKNITSYAHSKGILIGSYSLFSSRKISEEDDIISPLTGKTGGAFFGNAPCFGSKWGLQYREKIKFFLGSTGFDIWENDGPYPGDICASTNHPGHRDVQDSQWQQMEIQKELYRWCNQHGIYVNAPDWYFLDGTHKIALGYREVNFSLSRDQQKILNRQNIFDGTWEKTSSMGWGFVPLTKYQGGGPEAVLEPLSEHLTDYEQLMMQYYGAGVQACYRGPRLYDTDATKQMVIRVIDWYKKYREILNSDIIHLRRADGRDWDGWLHVNPSLKQKGLMMVFNPLQQAITRNITVPLYYTGLTKSASISVQGAPAKQLTLNRNYEITIPVTLAAGEYKWILIE